MTRKELIEKLEKGDVEISEQDFVDMELNEISAQSQEEGEVKMKIIINVSENFEPGVESIGDFVIRAAAELCKVGQLCNRKYDGDLAAAVKAAACELVTLAGKY